MTHSETNIVEFHGLSHVGIVREDNQDSIQMREDTSEYGSLYAVADGMGGYSHGGVASSLALETLFETFYAGNPAKTAQNLKTGIQNANLEIFKTAQRMGIGRMGTTLTAAHINSNKMTIAHVGDSRAYLIRDGKAACLTNDHTQVGEMVRMRILSADKVRTHANRSVLNKCLGVDLMVQADVFSTPIRNDDTIVLCSDGVWSVIEDEEFATMRIEIPNIDVLSQRILDLAMERESDDNISVVTVHVRQAPESEAESRRSWSLRGLFSARS